MIEKKILGKVDGIEIGLADSTLAGRFTQEELEVAFKRVRNKKHWKGPIDALVHESLREVTAAAIEHFTATEATFHKVAAGGIEIPGLLCVTAPGYWAGPAN